MVLETSITVNNKFRMIFLRFPISVYSTFLKHLDYVYLRVEDDLLEISPIPSSLHRKKRKILKTFRGLYLPRKYFAFLSKSNKVVWNIENGSVVGRVYYDKSNRKVLDIRLII